MVDKLQVGGKSIDTKTDERFMRKCAIIMTSER